MREGTFTVDVWGTPQQVDVHRKSKTVWIASGTYMGQHVEVKSSTPGSALKLWKDAARYKGG